MLRKTEEAVPSRNQHHVILQVFALDFELLHDHDIGLQYIEHALECLRRTPWLISEGIADPIDIPSRYP